MYDIEKSKKEKKIDMVLIRIFLNHSFTNQKICMKAVVASATGGIRFGNLSLIFFTISGRYLAIYVFISKHYLSADLFRPLREQVLWKMGTREEKIAENALVVVDEEVVVRRCDDK